MTHFNTLQDKLNKKQKELKLDETNKNVVIIQDKLYSLHLKEMNSTLINTNSSTSEILNARDSDDSINESASDILQKIIDLKKQ